MGKLNILFWGVSNPLYNDRLSTSLGAFFRILHLADCLSKNLPADKNMKWTTDASGRPVSGLDTEGNTMSFTYQ